MKAIVQQVYGPPTRVLEPKDIPVPDVGDEDVLVHVRAASLRIGNYFAVRGAPFLVRMSTGLRRPKVGVPGFDVAGEVVKIGANVTRFMPGDKVFGAGIGACAEYATAPESQLVHKPSSLSFDEAAAIPTSALAALHGLRDAARLEHGQHVLINGASGGVGTFAVQIAKSMGAEVTGVCSTRNVDLVRSLGADHVIDYTKEDFTMGDRRYDVIFDNVENHPLGACRRALVPTGTLVLNSGTGASGLSMLVRLIKPLLISPFVGHRLKRFLSNPNQADLVHLKEMVEKGELRPVVGRTFPLAQTVSAFDLIESGHATGNIVVALSAA